jgi:hypothetical protein
MKLLWPLARRNIMGNWTSDEWDEAWLNLKDTQEAFDETTRYLAALSRRLPDDDFDEDRMDIIGQNGNDALHYDSVDSPSHYMVLDKEVIDIIRGALTPAEFKGYCLGNIIKYRMRAGKKIDALEDIAKADKYEGIWNNGYE